MSASRRHVVVVLNWNGRDDTLRCVESLVDGSPDVDVLVVDNGSFDGALDAVASRWPHVHRLQLDANRGFSGGMNSGLVNARDVLRAEVITILNNDTIVPGGAMRALESVADRGEVAVSPQVMYLADPQKIWFGGGSLDVENGYPYHTAPEDLGHCRDGVRPTTMLAGCCVTARTSVWQSAGLFDDRFFLNFEDSEWSLRANRRGVRLLVACEVRILHAVSASFVGAAAKLGTFYFIRNGLLFSRIAGAGPLARVRFLRRFALSGLRRQSTRVRLRTLLVVAWAALADTARVYGEAPRALRRRVARWSVEESRVARAAGSA